MKILANITLIEETEGRWSVAVVTEEKTTQTGTHTFAYQALAEAVEIVTGKKLVKVG